MSVLFKLSVIFIYLLLVTQRTLGSSTEQVKDLDSLLEDSNRTNDKNFTFLISGGYRPTKHILTKYLVSIRTLRNDHFCAGTILAPKVILTAAHCVVRSSGKLRKAWDILVVAGATRRLEKDNDTVLERVETISKHPEYHTSEPFNDVAILILSNPLKENNKTIQRAYLPSLPPLERSSCQVVGWGRIFSDGPMSDEALYADTSIWSRKRCEYALKEVPYHPSMLCAYNERNAESDACAGDSGGPLFCNQILVGVVSFGFGCGTPGYPGIYANVWYFKEWVLHSKSNELKPTLKTILFLTCLFVLSL